MKRHIQTRFILKSCDCCKCEFESLFVEFKYRGNKFILGGLYRHPNGKVNHFTQDLEKTFDKVGKDAICIFAGDIYIDHLNFEHEQVLNYMTTFLSYKFLPYISLPTRNTHHSATCIDHNFTKCPHSLNNIDISSGILFCDISDHLPCFMSVAADGKK